MKTMKLLPLKIAVTSAMIVGLGAASTANAQAQSNISPLERAQGLINKIDFDKLLSQNKKWDSFQSFMVANQYANVAVMEELNKNVEENKRDLSAVTGKAFKNQIDIQRNNDSIEDLYEANHDNVERLVEHDRAIEILAEAGNHHDTLIRKNKADIKASNGKIESLKTLYETTVRTVGNNEKAIEEHRKLIADNKANIKTLAKAQLESVTFLGEQIQENKDDISTLTRKSFQNQVDIVRNNASIEDLYAYGEEVAKSIGEIHTHNEEQNKTLENLITNSTNNTDNIDKNKAKIQKLAEAQLESVTFLGEQIQENKDDISAVTGKAFKNQIDIQKNNDSIEDLYAYGEEVAKSIGEIHDHNRQQNETIQDLITNSTKNTDSIDKNKADADAKFKGVQTDIANNKITLAEHTKKIDDNQKAIEAKLGGKADLQKLSELKTSVDKNQADIQLHDQKINNLGILHSMVARAVGANKDRIDQNKADIAKNNESIEDLYEANAENVERLTQVDNNVFVNRLNIQELERKQENDIKDVIGMQNAIAEQADKNKNHIQDLAKAQLAGVEVMDELNKNVEKNKADADANFETLTKNQNALIEKDKAQDTLIAKNKADADASFETLTKNQNALIEKDKAQDTLIAKNKADADASFETLTKNQNALIEKDKAQDTLIAKNKADADASFETLTKNQNALIEKDKAQDTLIAKNKADADAKFTGVQTDIANNKTTLAQHAKKINDNQQAIEAKLGGKADAQALNSLNDKVNGFDGRISALDTKVNAFDGRITALDSKVENGMAAQAALSGLFQPYSVGKFNATAALGGYGSKSAVAIGAGYRVNPNLAIKAGAAINTSGDKKGSYNIGVNYEF